MAAFSRSQGSLTFPIPALAGYPRLNQFRKDQPDPQVTPSPDQTHIMPQALLQHTGTKYLTPSVTL